MQFKFFMLPVADSTQGEDELNKFLRSHRILTTERHFCPEKATCLMAFIDKADCKSLKAQLASTPGMYPQGL